MLIFLWTRDGQSQGELSRQVAIDIDHLEIFSDGVIAVAITLLVLNITVPEPGAKQTLWQALASQWPRYLGYVTSFLVSCIHSLGRGTAHLVIFQTKLT